MEPITIQYCSDLHLEFPENKKFIEENPLQKHGDILVLAGDIVPFSQINEHHDFFNKIADQFEMIYWLPGNHEYYYSDIADKNGSFKESIRNNIILLNNSLIELPQASIIFSTLWTKISDLKSDIIENRLSDFFTIKNEGLSLRVKEYNSMHERNVQFLQDAISHSQDKKTIVVTHHVPTFTNYPLRFANSPINEAFAVELKKMIEIYQPDHWIYGHSHVNTPSFLIGKTQMLTNQLGYIRYNENQYYRKEAIIRI